ncbi:C-type lectin domain-containing protein 161 [Girardinichthys multiradiatus]|uniref:C-type lectin domain-containing protein 161 n=1 Tax=Girardinichthys multiradiatus TaxID=208333 RepID=UPI001FACE6D0|nr:C-type lectin domain-containing protein 161 [Girardinichthys multiradiatus]
MKTLVLLFVGATVVLGMPHVKQNPVAGEENQPPVAGDRIPIQGHVVVEHPAPQVLLSPKDKQENTAPAEQKQEANEAELETKEKQDVKEVQEMNAELEVKVEEELKPEQEPAPEASVEGEAIMEPGVESVLIEEPDFKVESEDKVKVEGLPQYELEEEEDKVDPDFMMQSGVRLDTDVQMDLEPEEAPVVNEAPETFQAQVDVDREIDPEMEVEERHIDMEGKLLPIMELEPLDDGDVPGEEVSNTGLSEEEMAFREAFQEQDTVAEYVPEEEEEEEEDKVDGEEDFQEQKENHVADEQEIPELQPELTGEKNPEDIPNAMVLDEELIDPVPQQMMLLSENYFPEEEAGMEMYVNNKRAPEPFSEEPGMEDEGLPMMIGGDTYRQGERYCPGVITDGKCYQFYKEPKTYEDAEFFCQEQFSGGHLASIISQHVHQVLMQLIEESGGYTRTWVGGRRLDSDRFVWLDGSRWTYDDWLPGEPNHTAGLEYCLEVLGNGKFNDFTCWEPQAFICSYPSQ